MEEMEERGGDVNTSDGLYEVSKVVTKVIREMD